MKFYHGEHVIDSGECAKCGGETQFRMDQKCPPCSFAEVQ